MADPRLLARASDPTTPPAELRELVRKNHGEIRSRVAANPNAPLDLLLSLLLQHTAQVMQNGTFLLALLERPLLLKELPHGARSALAASPHIDEAMFWMLHESASEDRTRQIFQLLAANPASPPSYLEGCLLSTDPRTRSFAAQNPSTPPGRLRLLIDAGADPDLEGLRHPERGVPATLEQIASWGGWGEVFAAMHPNTPDGLLRRLARSETQANLRALATNPSTPEEVLRQLDADGSFEIQLSRNPSTPPELLVRFASSPDPAVRGGVAQNPSAAPEVLVGLLGDMEEGIRARAAAHERTPDEWRRRLARLGLPGDLRVTPVLNASRLHPGDLEALLGGRPWFLVLLALVDGLPSWVLLQLARRIREESAWHGCTLLGREDLPACVVELLLRWERLPEEGRASLLQRYPTARTPAIHEGNPLRAPSLRAPVEIGQWLVRPGERVEGGLPLVELLCKANDAVVRVCAPEAAQVEPVVLRGEISPGQALAQLRRVDAGEARGSPASRRIRELLGQPPGPAPSLLPVPSRIASDQVVELRLGQCTESMSEGLLSRWSARPGGWLQEGTTMVSVGLDKCDIELTAPHSGIILEQAQEDATLAVGEVYLRLLVLKQPPGGDR